MTNEQEPRTPQAQRAAGLLRHYLSMLARASGVTWDYDNDAEIEDIVDSIIEAAKVETMKETEGDGRSNEI